jgi:Protein of unknown function (DUF3467)
MSNQKEKTPQEAPKSAAKQPQPAGNNRIEIDDSGTQSTYANFCRVTGTPEELILDFGVNSQPFGTPTDPIAIDQRLILNFYTAKRMLYALQMTIQRQEATFGVLETDVQKRVVVNPNRMMSRPPVAPPAAPTATPAPATDSTTESTPETEAAE